MRYQVLDPSFNKGNLGGNLITVIDGIATVTMTPQQASYWLTQGAVQQLGAAGQLNYQLASRGLVVGSPIFDLPIENVVLLAINFACASPTIDASVIDEFSTSSLTTASPDLGAPTLA